MKLSKTILLTALPILATSSAGIADTSSPRLSPTGNAPYTVPYRPIELKNVPDFPTYSDAPSNNSTALKAGLESTTLPVSTRLKLVVEYPLDAKTSRPGDIFEGHVKDDLFVGRNLLLPRGSLVRGRVVAVTKPRLLSRAAKIGLKLEQIDTPTGEVIPLDAALEFQKGVSDQKGDLDPGTSFGSRVGGEVKAVTGIKSSSGTTHGALMAANVATLGAPAVATLLGGSAIALFRSGDNISIQPGQEIEILLTNDLGLQIN